MSSSSSSSAPKGTDSELTGEYKDKPKDVTEEVNLADYFPDADKFKGQRMSDKSLYSIGTPREGKEVVDMIKLAMSYAAPSTKPADITITDSTAHVGGHTISTARAFKHVNAVELDPVHFEMLENNVNVYKLTNVSMYNDDYLKVYAKLAQDVVLTDPPWGGPDYAKINPLAEYALGEVELTDLLRLLKEQTHTKVVIFKVGRNIDMTSFVKKMPVEDIWFARLKGYCLIVCFTRALPLPDKQRWTIVRRRHTGMTSFVREHMRTGSVAWYKRTGGGPAIYYRN